MDQLYKVFDNGVSQADVLQILAQPAPVWDSVFVNRELCKFTINSAELHKTKSGEPVIYLCEGVTYSITGRSSLKRNNSEALPLVRTGLFAFRPNQAGYLVQPPMPDASIQQRVIHIDRASSRGVVDYTHLGHLGVEFTWKHSEGFSLNFRLLCAWPGHPKASQLKLQIDVYENENNASQCIQRATCWVRLAKDLVERRSSDRRKRVTQQAPSHTEFANGLPLGPSPAQSMSSRTHSSAIYRSTSVNEVLGGSLESISGTMTALSLSGAKEPKAMSATNILTFSHFQEPEFREHPLAQHTIHSSQPTNYEYAPRLADLVDGVDPHRSTRFRIKGVDGHHERHQRAKNPWD